MQPVFEAGKNIAIKVPPHQYEETISFYREILGLKQVDVSIAGLYESVGFEFGDKTLWVDKIDAVSQAEIWLEIRTDNADEAARYLDKHGVARRDEIEPLPDSLAGFWVTSPAGIIHLVNE
jgi:catechol 2,3-dioxygenase-like lactoylglutathione lyase family enzyme